MIRRDTIAVVLVAVAIASVWVWRVFSADRAVPATRAEASASYYPEDAVAYAWLTLAPGEGPSGNPLRLLDQFDALDGIPGLAGKGEGLLPDAFGMVVGELAAWMGTEVSAAAVDRGDGQVSVAVTVGVRDRDAAAEFLQDWLPRQEDGGATSFERHVVGDVVLWIAGGGEHMGDQVYAQVGDLLLFATDRGLLEEVLKRIDGGHGDTLASAERFEEARAAGPHGRFAGAYVDLEWLAGRMGDPERNPCEGGLIERPEWLVVSADWTGNGLIVDLVTQDVTSWWTDTSASAADVLVPATAVGFVSMGFDPHLDRWREVLDGCEIADLIPGGYLFDPPDGEKRGVEATATLADALDLVLRFVDLGTGLDLEADLFDHLGGQLVIAAHGPAREGSFVEGVAALSYRPLSVNALAGTMNGIARGVSELTGVSLYRIDLGAARPSGLMEDGTPPSFGYMVHNGFLTFGTSVEALETTVAVQGGARDRISATDEYRRTVEHIAYDPLLLAYLDIAKAIGLIDHPSTTESDGDLLGMLSRWLSPVAVGVGTDGDYSRATLVLPFARFMDAFMAGDGGG